MAHPVKVCNSQLLYFTTYRHSKPGNVTSAFRINSCMIEGTVTTIQNIRISLLLYSVCSRFLCYREQTEHNIN